MFMYRKFQLSFDGEMFPLSAATIVLPLNHLKLGRVLLVQMTAYHHR